MTKTIDVPGVGERGLGWRPDTPDHRDRVSDHLTRESSRLPEVFSLRKKMPPVFDQGQLGSCVSNGVAALYEAERKRQGERSVRGSRLFLYYEGRVIEHTVEEDSGLEVRDGVKVAATKGVPHEKAWPYNIERFTEKPGDEVYAEAVKFEAIEYLRVSPGGRGSPIRTPIFKGFPVTFGFTVFDKFEGDWNPEKQYLPLPKLSEGTLGGHCTDVIGWDFSKKRFPVNVFEIRNSWSKAWGDEGHFYMDARWLYEPRNELASDFWIIECVK